MQRTSYPRSPLPRNAFGEEDHRTRVRLNDLVDELAARFAWPPSPSVTARAARSNGSDQLQAALAAAAVGLRIAPLSSPGEYPRALATKDPQKLVAFWTKWPNAIAAIRIRGKYAALLEPDDEASIPLVRLPFP